MGSNPTLSAIPGPLNLLLRILWRPDEGWEAVRTLDPGWLRPLFQVVIPLAVLPAIAWPIGHAVDPIGPDATGRSLTALFAITFAFSVGAVVVAAAAIYALAPVFSVQRRWRHAIAVAAYASVPVFLASPLLASPTLTILVVAAFFHSCVLCSQGLRRLLRCRSEDAAMYVAAAAFVAGLAGLVLGGLSSAAGIL